MKVLVHWGQKNTNAKFRMEGKRLADVRKSLDSRDEWGLFEGYVTDRSGRIDTRNGAVSRVTLTPWYKISMPSWPSYRQQAPRDQERWDTMWKALMEHERGHLDIFLRGFEKLTNDLKALEEVQESEIQTLLEKATEEIQEKHDAYDRRTDHGRSAGVVL